MCRETAEIDLKELIISMRWSRLGFNLKRDESQGDPDLSRKIKLNHPDSTRGSAVSQVNWRDHTGGDTNVVEGERP